MKENILEDALQNILPHIFFTASFLNVYLWQWSALIALFALSYILACLCSRFTLSISSHIIQRNFPSFDKKVLGKISLPLLLEFIILFFAIGFELLNLEEKRHTQIRTFEILLFILVFTWLTFRMVDACSQWLQEFLYHKKKISIVTMLPLGRRVFKTIVVTVATLSILQTLGFNITALIAGLGVGGIAIALAAQKTLENLFGGAMLILDQPIRVGDLCGFNSQKGTIEEIGLRSTKIRTLERTLISIPNSNLSQIQIENFTARDHILFNCTLGLRHETTIDQLRYVLIELRKLLYAHPCVDNDPARVRLVKIGEFSLDIEIFAYILTSSHYDFTAMREDLLLKIIDIIQTSGTNFAFPSNTTYVATDTGLSPEKTKASEKIIQKLRENFELALPEFSKSQIEKLDGKINYPDKGSVMR